MKYDSASGNSTSLKYTTPNDAKFLKREVTGYPISVFPRIHENDAYQIDFNASTLPGPVRLGHRYKWTNREFITTR